MKLMKNDLFKYSTYLIISSLLIIFGWFFSNIYQNSASYIKITDLNSSEKNLKTQNKSDLVLIYIGCSTCAAANHEQLPSAIKKLKINLDNFASNNDLEFHSIGVSKEVNPTQELKYLSKFGSFSEISIGKNWSNSIILKYIWDDFGGRPVVPQIIVTKRDYEEISSSSNSTFYRGIANEKILLTRYGPNGIINWLNIGAPLPLDNSQESL